MKRKEYQKPTMKVLEFQQRHEMLVQSQQNVGVQNYGMTKVGEFKDPDPTSSSLPNYLDNDWRVVNPEALFAE